MQTGAAAVAGALGAAAALSRCSPAPARVTLAPESRLHPLVSRCPSLRSYFPTPWLPGPHLNTLFASLFRGAPASVGFTRTWLPLSDGGIVTLDWSCLPRQGQPVLVILHGLTGGSHERYVQWLIAAVSVRIGACCVVLNARGCSETELSSPLGFSAAFTGDVRSAITAIRTAVGPSAPLLAAGFSLGAGILLNFLADEGSACDLVAAAALSGSYDFVANSAALEKTPIRQTYNRYLAHSLVAYFRRHRHHFRAPASGPAIDWKVVQAARTIRDFDEAVIVPLFGYASSHAYYVDASVGRRLRHVAVPTLLLNASDDPICSSHTLPIHEVLANPHLVSAVTSEGGHVAWSSGWWPTGASWDNDAVVEWLGALLDEHFHGAGSGPSASRGVESHALAARRRAWEAAAQCDVSTVASGLRFEPPREAFKPSAAPVLQATPRL